MPVNCDATVRPVNSPAQTENPLASVNFDHLARAYSTLEWLAFGHALEHTRFRNLGELRNCREILLLGDGDGRALARLAQLAPMARMHYVDSSPVMLACAEARLDRSARARVTFTCADVFTCPLPTAHYDAVTTLFFLDIFTPAQVTALVARLQPCLRPAARWLWVDFVLPEQGLARWRAQVWLRMMYAFFRWQTGIPAHSLPPTEAIFRQAGWLPLSLGTAMGGLVRTGLFSQPGCGT